MKQKIILIVLLLAGLVMGSLLAGPAARRADANGIPIFFECGPGVVAFKLSDEGKGMVLMTGTHVKNTQKDATVYFQSIN